jgi:hypothetical protein
MNMGKLTKADSRDGSQHPRGAELAPRRGVVRHKGWERGWGNKPTSQNGASGGSLSWSCGSEGGTQNWIATPCWRKRWPDRVVAILQCAASWWKQDLWPPCMDWKWVTSDPICNLPWRQKEQNTAHKPVTWWDHLRVPSCNGQPIRQRKLGKKTKKKFLQLLPPIPHKPKKDTKSQYHDWMPKE